MNIGIVGSEAAKFTLETEEKARVIIKGLIQNCNGKVVSGGCHLGGIDIWAKEEAEKLNIPFIEFLPKVLNWNGFKARNILIAKTSDIVYCITVKTLPAHFKEGGWERFCYHCNTNGHIKSGGCWTVKEAKRLGKQGSIIVIE